MHFLKLRLHLGAQHEIRVYALGMLKLALPHFPVALQAWKDFHGSSIPGFEQVLSDEQLGDVLK